MIGNSLDDSLYYSLYFFENLIKPIKILNLKTGFGLRNNDSECHKCSNNLCHSCDSQDDLCTDCKIEYFGDFCQIHIPGCAEFEEDTDDCKICAMTHWMNAEGDCQTGFGSSLSVWTLLSLSLLSLLV